MVVEAQPKKSARTILMNGLSPRPFCESLEVRKKQAIWEDAHVSHRMGNSLCSHPALLMSALGGIFGKDDGTTTEDGRHKGKPSTG